MLNGERIVRLTSLVLAVALTLGAAPAGTPSSEGEAGAIGRTPPRLSYTDGEVSFWRPGAQDWAPAQVNTPLAPGDELYTGNRGNLELQVAPRAFVRAWGDTQLGLVNQEPDFLQIKVTRGHLSLDLRGLDPGRTVELDTPHAAFTIERSGYYRVDVTQNATSFITRRAGQATMTPAGGQAVVITSSEEVVLEGTPAPNVRSYVAPELDAWDRWNYARTDDLLDSLSARYVSSGVYGVDDLDHYGDWRVVPDYGAVWVPQAVPAGWAPYSTGRWVSDPYYGWTWVDTAPWGWAPYHHGRWVFVNGFWAWAPGPVIVRPVYAPALVAFFGGPSVRVAIGVPGVSWVALGWGEPLVPWWGRSQFIGRPSWVGWGGPRVVNNVVVNRTTVVNVTNITVYKNTSVQNAVVAVREENFGRRAVNDTRIARVDARRLEPARAPLRVTPDASSYVAASGHAVRPAENTISRSVVATRPPSRHAVAPRAETSRGGAPQATPSPVAPAPRIVPAPKPAATAPVPARPPFGPSPTERQRPPLPRRFEPSQQPEGRGTPQNGGPRTGAAPVAPREGSAGQREGVGNARPTPPPSSAQPAPRPEAQAAPAPQSGPPRSGPVTAAPREGAGGARPVGPPSVRQQRGEPGRGPQQSLPGEPANRISPARAETRPQQPQGPQQPQRQQQPERQQDRQQSERQQDRRGPGGR